MIRLIVAATVCFAMGCGPMPGYVPPRTPAVHQPEQQPGGPPVASTGDEPIQVIDTGRPGTYYLVDMNRRLCFFQNGTSVGPIDCSGIPEAVRLLGDDIAAAPEEAPRRPSRSDRADLRERVEPPAAPVEPERPVEPEPPVEPVEQPSEAAVPTPSVEEKRNFTMAYVTIFCDRRRGGNADATKIIATNGLTLDRYQEIEGWMASDERAWRALRSASLSSCQDDEPGT